MRWAFLLALWAVPVLAFIGPACARQTSREQKDRIAQWIDELGDKDDAKRIEAKTRLREALAEDPTGPVSILLRHANVIREKQEVRRECRDLLLEQQRAQREEARKLAAEKLGLPLNRIIDISYLPHVLNNVFLFAIFNLQSLTAGPAAKAYVSVRFTADQAQPMVQRHDGGISAEGLSRLIAASGFNIRSAEDALDVAVLAAGLSSTDHADGWCLVPRPGAVAPCDRWPAGSTLPLNLQQKAVAATATATTDETAFRVRITTWAAVGGRVANWTIQVTRNGAVTVEHHEVIGGAFGIGFS